MVWRNAHRAESVTVDPAVGGTTDVQAALTAQAAAVSALSGIASGELAVIDGVTPGTAAAGKAVVLTTGKVIDTIDVTALKVGGAAVTSSAAELNKLDGAGAVVASGTAAAHIDDPTGAVTDQDDEARTAIAAILNALEAFGIVLAS